MANLFPWAVWQNLMQSSGSGTTREKGTGARRYDVDYPKLITAHHILVLFDDSKLQGRLIFITSTRLIDLSLFDDNI